MEGGAAICLLCAACCLSCSGCKFILENARVEMGQSRAVLRLVALCVLPQKEEALRG